MSLGVWLATLEHATSEESASERLLRAMGRALRTADVEGTREALAALSRESRACAVADKQELLTVSLANIVHEVVSGLSREKKEVAQQTDTVEEVVTEGEDASSSVAVLPPPSLHCPIAQKAQSSSAFTLHRIPAATVTLHRIPATTVSPTVRSRAESPLLQRATGTASLMRSNHSTTVVTPTVPAAVVPEQANPAAVRPTVRSTAVQGTTVLERPLRSGWAPPLFAPAQNQSIFEVPQRSAFSLASFFRKMSAVHPTTVPPAATSTTTVAIQPTVLPVPEPAPTVHNQAVVPGTTVSAPTVINQATVHPAIIHVQPHESSSLYCNNDPYPVSTAFLFRPKTSTIFAVTRVESARPVGGDTPHHASFNTTWLEQYKRNQEEEREKHVTTDTEESLPSNESHSADEQEGAMSIQSASADSTEEKLPDATENTQPPLEKSTEEEQRMETALPPVTVSKPIEEKQSGTTENPQHVDNSAPEEQEKETTLPPATASNPIEEKGSCDESEVVENEKENEEEEEEEGAKEGETGEKDADTEVKTPETTLPTNDNDLHSGVLSADAIPFQPVTHRPLQKRPASLSPAGPDMAKDVDDDDDDEIEILEVREGVKMRRTETGRIRMQRIKKEKKDGETGDKENM